MNHSIVNKIKGLADENNISIGDLEKTLGFSQGLISRWDKNSPSVDKILSVCNFFQVSSDYILGNTENKQSTKIEDKFIEKLITDTKNYELKWQQFSMQFVSENDLFYIFHNLYCSIDDNNPLKDIEAVYELEYNASCIYLICAEYDYKLSFFLLLQLDKTNKDVTNNFVSISNYSDFKQTNMLEHEVSLYLKTFEIKDKSRLIMKKFINNVNSDTTNEPVLQSHVINSLLVTLPGFVLDARAGATLSKEILKLQSDMEKVKIILNNKYN